MLENEQATVAFGAQIGLACKHYFEHNNSPLIITLHGDLGAGKTTFSRGVLNAFDYSGNVKSPTYTLVEPYELNEIMVYHFDLYRLGDPEELEYIGFRDYFSGKSLSLIEWPEKAAGFLPPIDLSILLQYEGLSRTATVTKHNKKIEL